MTHFAHGDYPADRRGLTRALCGARINLREHAPTPTCPTCVVESGASAEVAPAAAIDLFNADPDSIIEIEPEPVPDTSSGFRRVLGFVTSGIAAQRAIDALTPAPPSIEALERRATIEPTLVAESRSAVDQALALDVIDAATCLQGKELFDTLREFEAAVGLEYDEDCGLAYRLWKNLTDKRGVILKPIEAARKFLGDRVAAWELKEKERELAEGRARDIKAREEQTAAATRTAKQLLRGGDVEGAAAVIADAHAAPAPIVPRPVSSIPSTSRTTTRQKWIADIDDVGQLLTAIATDVDADGKRRMTEFDADLREVLVTALCRLAPTMKGELGKKYPGARGFLKGSLAGR